VLVPLVPRQMGSSGLPKSCAACLVARTRSDFSLRLRVMASPFVPARTTPWTPEEMRKRRCLVCVSQSISCLAEVVKKVREGTWMPLRAGPESLEGMMSVLYNNGVSLIPINGFVRVMWW